MKERQRRLYSRKSPVFILLLACLALSFFAPAEAGDVEQATPPVPTAGVDRDTMKETARVVAVRKDQPFLVAVLPVENLSGRPAPLKQIRQLLTEGLKSRGVGILPEADLQKFMARHRMRFTGGIHNELSKALLQETGTKAVLITSVDYFTDIAPPKLAFSTRLVSTGEEPGVLWMNSLGMAGDDHPGILGLGLIVDPGEILRKGVENSLDSLRLSLTGESPKVSIREMRVPGIARWKKAKFQPKHFYRSPGIGIGKGGTLTVAVIPFLNHSTRKYAGEVMALHFASRLAEVENLRVVEPGAVRQELLRHRIIMQDGLSIPQVDLLFAMLGADLGGTRIPMVFRIALLWLGETLSATAMLRNISRKRAAV
jgi:hypothetical protein